MHNYEILFSLKLSLRCKCLCPLVGNEGLLQILDHVLSASNPL